MTKQETYDYLNTHGISYEVTDHPAVFNMAELEAVELPYPDADAKNLFVRDDKKRNYYLITVKGDKRVDLKQFRREHGLRNLTFAGAEDLMSMLGLEAGSVTPLGLLNDKDCRVELYLDADFTDIIGVHPNDNTATVWMQPGDLKRLVEEHGNSVHTFNL